MEIWSSSGGTPGALLFSESVGAASVTRTQVAGNWVFQSPVDLYDFDLDLTGAFNAVAGTTYWFSIQSTAASFYPLFGWSSAAAPGASYQEALNGAGNVAETFVRNSNRAFALYEDGVVPEPHALTLAAVAVAGLAVTSRRRKQRG